MNCADNVLASATWIGGLVPLAILLAAATQDDDPTWATTVRAATLRFSTLGIISVSTLLGTGAVNAWVLVGSFPALVRTDYGLLVLVKIALFSVMLSLATINRLWLTPRLCLPSRAASPKNTVRQLVRNSTVEAVIGLIVFAVVGLLGTLHPAIHLLSP